MQYTNYPRLPPHVPSVKRQLLTLKHIPVRTSALPRPRTNHSIQSARLELPLNRRLHLAQRLIPRLLLALHGSTLLRRRLLLLPRLLPTAAQRLSVMVLVPGAEGRGVDLDDGGLGEGVGADELVVRRVVRHLDDAGFAGDGLGAPGEVPGVEAQGPVLGVAAADADGVDALGADAGGGGLAAFLEGSAGG